MKMTRLISAILFAAVTTTGLVLLMNALISKDWKEPEEVEKRKIADIRLPEREIDTRYDTSKPEKPEQVEQAPEMPEPEFDAPDVSAEAVNISAPQVASDVDVSFSNFKSDGEYLPIVRVEPIYPSRAAARGIEGYVIVEFTVTTNGSVRDPVIIEAEPSSIFNRAAQRAVVKWKYKPRVVDGQPVEVPGVRTQLTFQLEQ